MACRHNRAATLPPQNAPYASAQRLPDRAFERLFFGTGKLRLIQVTARNIPGCSLGFTGPENPARSHPHRQTGTESFRKAGSQCEPRPTPCLPAGRVPWNTSAVRRAVVIVFFALLTFDVSGLAMICGNADCDESCPADVSGGQCSPNCHFCSCCSLPKVMSPGSTTTFTPPMLGYAWIQSSEAPTSPEPADILHVPISLLA